LIQPHFSIFRRESY